jgi:putative Mn2+ efflux pump MntP
MNLLDVFFIGVGLSMDAFAVSICKGLKMKVIDLKQSFIIAFFFGAFDAFNRIRFKCKFC